MIVLDSNIIIEILKGNDKVINRVEEIGLENVCLTYITVMEVIYGARNKREKKIIEEFLRSFEILYSNENIDMQAVEYINKFSLSHDARIPDVIIAAICVYYHYELFTFNLKDFVYIPGIKIMQFDESKRQ